MKPFNLKFGKEKIIDADSMQDIEHMELMEKARDAIEAARLTKTNSLKISEAMIWLDLHRPIAAFKALAHEI